MKLSRECLIQIGKEMNDAPKASIIAKEWADKLGLSYKTIFNLCKKLGVYDSGKKRKSTAGQIDEATKEEVFKLAAIYHTLQPNKKPGVKGKMPLEVALEIYYHNFPDAKLKGSTSTIYSYFRKFKISRKDIQLPAPKISLKTLYPNQLWCYDTGVCDYYLDKDDKIIYISASEDYKNKAGRYNKKRRLVRHLIIDMFSGAFFVYYSHTQTRIDYADFLFLAFSQKDDIRYIFHGIPEGILMDNDAGLRSYPLMRLFKYLNVQIPKIEPYRPWAKGAVEELMKTWARWFETRFLFQKSADLDTINKWAQEYAIKFQKTRIHSRHHETRFACWDKYITNHLTEICDYKSFKRLVHMEAVTREVNSEGYFSYKGPKYKAPGLFSTTIDVVEHLHAYAESKAVTIFWPSQKENQDNYLDFEVQQYTVTPENITLGGYEDSNVTALLEQGKSPSDERTINKQKVLDINASDMKLKSMDIPDTSSSEIEFIPKTGASHNVSSQYNFNDKIYSKTQLKLQLATKMRRILHKSEIDHINNLTDETFSTEDLENLFNFFIEQKNLNKIKAKGA